MLGTITKGEYKNDPLPNNVYLSKLLNVKEKLVEFVKPENNEAIKYTKLTWTFEILTEPFKKRRAYGKTPSNWIANKKLDNWLVAVGINASKGQSVRIEDIKDLYVKIVTKNKPYKDAKTGEDKNFPEVTELLPLDSLDQIKIRELVAGTNVVASATTVVPQQPVQPMVAPSNPATTGGFVPGTTSVPTFVSPQPNPVSVPTFTPAPNVTGTPSRTIPF